MCQATDTETGDRPSEPAAPHQSEDSGEICDGDLHNLLRWLDENGAEGRASPSAPVNFFGDKLSASAQALRQVLRWVMQRDAYIVKKGLWLDFVDSLPRPIEERALARDERVAQGTDVSLTPQSASTVRAEVIEECAQVADKAAAEARRIADSTERLPTKAVFLSGASEADSIASALRSLKGGK